MNAKTCKLLRKLANRAGGRKRDYYRRWKLIPRNQRGAARKLAYDTLR